LETSQERSATEDDMARRDASAETVARQHAARMLGRTLDGTRRTLDDVAARMRAQLEGMRQERLSDLLKRACGGDEAAALEFARAVAIRTDGTGIEVGRG
jgi:hypothetical protein